MQTTDHERSIRVFSSSILCLLRGHTSEHDGCAWNDDAIRGIRRTRCVDGSLTTAAAFTVASMLSQNETETPGMKANGVLPRERPRKQYRSRPGKRTVGYRPMPAAATPALMFAAAVPIGRLPGGRVVVFTEGE
jgi:hypothetical protein